MDIYTGTVKYKASREPLIKQLRIDEDMAEELDELLEEALRLAKPKWVLRVLPVTVTDAEHVNLGAISFKSTLLAEKLKDVDRVCAYVATCGEELEAWSEGLEDELYRWWSGAIREQALAEALTEARAKAKELLGSPKLGALNPGSLKAWHIGNQKGLFEAIGCVKEFTGVELTESMLMLPIKSVSGVLFPLDYDESYENCSFCDISNCPNRRARFIGNN